MERERQRETDRQRQRQRKGYREGAEREKDSFKVQKDPFHPNVNAAHPKTADYFHSVKVLSCLGKHRDSPTILPTKLISASVTESVQTDGKRTAVTSK